MSMQTGPRAVIGTSRCVPETKSCDPDMVDFVCPPCEFGYELSFGLPYAYWLHTRNELKSTTSVTGTSPLYYFSPQHQEIPERRCYRKLREFDNSSFDLVRLNTSRWCPPPLRSHFAHFELPIQFVKPLLLLGNKLCDEWNKGPVHYLTPTVLHDLLTCLSDVYSIVYIRPGTSSTHRYSHDDNTVLEGDDDKQTVRLFADRDVHVFDDLLQNSNAPCYNTLQMALCARAADMVCVQGGFSVLACYFARRLLVYAREGAELRSGAYNSWFQGFSGTDVTVVKSPADLLQQCTVWHNEKHDVSARGSVGGGVQAFDGRG
jgi:hypothetical protein